MNLLKYYLLYLFEYLSIVCINILMLVVDNIIFIFNWFEYIVLLRWYV